MAGVVNVLFTQSFTATDSVVVNHNLGYGDWGVRVIVSEEVQNDLIEDMVPDGLNPLNSVTINLTAVVTGRIQIVSLDTTPATYIPPDVLQSVLTGGVVAPVGTPSTGDLLYYDGAEWVRLSLGTEGQVLTAGASDPQWAGPKRYSNSATDPVSPAPAEGDTYYNTSLQMQMQYDGSRSKWLSVESATFGFGRNGNLFPAGTYLRAINGMVTSATEGYDALYNGTVVGVTIRRSTQSVAEYAVVASGTDIATLAFPNLIFGVRTTTANGDFAQGSVLAARLVSDAVTPEFDVQMFVRIRWRAT